MFDAPIQYWFITLLYPFYFMFVNFNYPKKGLANSFPFYLNRPKSISIITFKLKQPGFTLWYKTRISVIGPIFFPPSWIHSQSLSCCDIKESTSWYTAFTLSHACMAALTLMHTPSLAGHDMKHCTLITVYRPTDARTEQWFLHARPTHVTNSSY